MAHTAAICEDGSVFGWGAGRKGQLGVKEKLVALPRRVELGFPAAAAACGREFSFFVSRNGERHRVLGEDGRFAMQTDSPAQGELRGFRKLGAGWGSVVVQLADGRLRAWGRNDRGQLPHAGVAGVRDLAVGSEHGVAVLDDNRLVAWGWGEHGNCGKSRDVDGGDVVGAAFNVRAPAAAAAVGGRLASAGAGCATSWVWAE